MSSCYSSHRPVVMGTNWMVTADHPLAARAGAQVLERGGNAVDAAVAANLVMAVVRPHMCGLGGDLFALVYSAEEGKVKALNASGRAPAKADLEFYRSKGFEAMPASGILTATVPGAASGWQALLEAYGSMGLDSLLATPIDYAEKGFPVYSELHTEFNNRKDVLNKSDAAKEVFFAGGRTPKVGTRLVQKDLAASLKLLAQKGPDAFYRGDLGRALVEFSGRAGGLFSMEDLERHTCNWLDPISTTYRDYQVITQPPNSQGIALLMQANMLDTVDISGMDPFGPDLIHRMVEGKKLAFADRDLYVCDPEFYPVPVDRLLDKAGALGQAGRIDPARAAIVPEARDFSQGGDDTIYLAVVDSQGNAVSLIQSIFEAFGSCTMVPETGILLHNRGRGFSLDPSHVNRLEPGKRPYHTLHPAMILKDGEPCYVLGSPGADGQTQTVSQLMAGLLDYGADVQQAMEAPRWRSNPDGSLIMEGRFPDATFEELKKRGHEVKVLEDWAPIMGSSQAIRIDRDQGVLMGGCDPRRQAYAVGK